MVALTPQADEGAQFVGWFGINGAEVNGNNELLMNTDKSLIARFELISAEEPEDEEFTDEDIPESGNVIEDDEEEVVPDQEVPFDGPTLPQTGGIPIELVAGAGFAFITAGISLRKKDKKEKE
jgi:LPXTG-motif cell wall-anchored protein